MIMHNGLRLSCNSIGSGCIRDILKANKGVAEPQHERAFAEILRVMGPSPLILDVGARNGFYSMWMKKVRPGARCVVVEPNKRHLENSRKNFALNKLYAQFYNAYVSMSTGRRVEGVEVVSVEEIARRLRADYINLLHADIEGYEMELIKGAIPVLKDRRVDYFVLSTHTDGLHRQCKALLETQRYLVIADIPPAMSYVSDGLLVARRSELRGLDVIPLSQKPAQPMMEEANVK